MLTTTEDLLFFLFIFTMLGSTYAGWLIRSGFESMKKKRSWKPGDE